MSPSELQLMHMRDHVRLIHRVLVGTDPPEPTSPHEGAATPTVEEVTRDFAALEAMARSLPLVAERVPPFSFAPPFDLIGTESETIVDVGLPGVARDAVEVELAGDRLIVWGARPVETPLDGRIYFHAEIPRGPFRREIRLPFTASGRPRVEVADGVVRIRIAKPSKSPLPKA
jgi:HSP20 family molecular chaperone IbpA